MLSHVSKFFSDIPITVTGMMIFFFVFIAVALWTFFRPHSKTFYQQIEQLPFSGDPDYE